MEKANKGFNPEFHAVEFMRDVRLDLSNQYLQDKNQYKLDLKKAMEEFKKKQKRIFHKQVD